MNTIAVRQAMEARRRTQPATHSRRLIEAGVSVAVTSGAVCGTTQRIDAALAA